MVNGMGRDLTMALLGLMKVPVASGNRPVYVISIAANLAGCHPRTLRIYEEEGLLEPVRTDTNIRLYSDEDLQRVRVIRYLTQVRGVNLAGVRLLLQFHDVADLLEELANALDQNGDGSADEKPTTF
jgi:MerR family transcriptional regulator/heat shock protein HspR